VLMDLSAFRIPFVTNRLFRVDHKRVFLSIPKNAGTYCSKVLGITQPGPAKALPREEWERLDRMHLIAVRRDPRERFYSAFIEYISRKNKLPKADLTGAILSYELEALEIRYINNRKPFIDEHLIPQEYWLQMYQPDEVWPFLEVTERLEAAGFDTSRTQKMHTSPYHLREWVREASAMRWAVVEALT